MPDINKPRFTAEAEFEFDDLETAQEWLGEAEERGMILNGELYDSGIFDYDKMEYVL